MAKQTSTPAAETPAEEQPKSVVEKAIEWLNDNVEGLSIGPLDVKEFKVHEEGGYINLILNGFQKYQVRLSILENPPTEG